MEFAITIDGKEFYVVVKTHPPTTHRPERVDWTIWEGKEEPIPRREHKPWDTMDYHGYWIDTTEAALDAVRAILEGMNG